MEAEKRITEEDVKRLRELAEGFIAHRNLFPKDSIFRGTRDRLAADANFCDDLAERLEAAFSNGPMTPPDKKGEPVSDEKRQPSVSGERWNIKRDHSDRGGEQAVLGPVTPWIEVVPTSAADTLAEVLERIASGRTSPDQAAHAAREALRTYQGNLQ